jgi:hypothetical protein
MSEAASLPDRLRCELSGTAGCAQDGICVGGGVEDKRVKLTLEPALRRLTLNGLEGHILGDQQIDSPGEHYVQWRWNIVGLDTFSIRWDRARYVLNLKGPAQAPSQDLAEFFCRKG